MLFIFKICLLSVLLKVVFILINLRLESKYILRILSIVFLYLIRTNSSPLKGLLLNKYILNSNNSKK